VGAGSVLLGACIALCVSPDHLSGTLVAYLDLLLITGAAAALGRQGTLQSLIPGMFLAWLAAAWPLASIYFALQSPTLAYNTLAGERQFLFAHLRVQAVTLAFGSTYLAVVLALRGRFAPWRTPAVSRRLDRRAALLTFAVCCAAVSLNAISKARPLPGLLQYLADGAYQYLHGLTLVFGALFGSLVLGMRVAVVFFLALTAVFYSIGNARGMAALPIALFLVGVLCFSDVERRWKRWIIIGALVCFPLGLVISNTTRAVTKTIGFQDLDRRLDAFGQWQEVLSQTPVLTSTLGRLFFTGGHTIVALSPESYRYVDFSMRRYFMEFLLRMLPRRFFGELYYSEQPNRILRNYGFLITDETSVPLSLIGSLYMLGGTLPVMVGAAVIGAFHSLVAWGLQLSRRVSPYLPLVVFAMISSELLWGQNRDPISHVRSVVWDAMWGVVLYYCILRPFLPVARVVAVRRTARLAMQSAP